MGRAESGWLHQLPSGKWSVTIYLPTGARRSYSNRLKGPVKTWARRMLEDIERGDWIDPTAAKTTVGKCYERWLTVRRMELATRRTADSQWRCWTGPRWERHQVGTIFELDVQAWVNELEKSHAAGCTDKRCRGCRIGVETIEGAVGVLRAVLDVAVADRMIRTNPARGVTISPRDAVLDRILDHEEYDALLAAADRIFPGRPDAGLMLEWGERCGLRWEEAAAVSREHVDQRQHLVMVRDVVERDRSIRPHPKTRAGIRSVAIPDEMWPRVRDRILEVPRGGLLVTSPQGGVLDYSRWRYRVWRVILAGKGAYPGARGHQPRPEIPGAGLEDPQPTFHDLRHTFGTNLAVEGVTPHEIMITMGHESLRSTERYLHAAKGIHDRVRRATSRAARGARQREDRAS